MGQDKKGFVMETRFALDLDDLNQGVRQAQSATKKAANDMSDNFEDVNKAVGLLKGTVGSMLAVFSVDKILDGLMFTTDAAEELHISMLGLRATARGFGEDGNEAEKAALGLADAVLSIDSAATGLKSLMGSNFSITESMNLTKAMKDIGAYNNVVGDLGQAYKDAAKGIKTGSIELIENIGLTKKLSSVMKDAGISIADGIDITNNAAQRQAFYNYIMEEAAKFQGNAAELAEQYTGKKAELRNEFDKLAVSVGKRFKPAMMSATTAITTGIKSLRQGIEGAGQTSEKLEPLVSRLDELKSKTNLTKAEQTELQEVMNQISIISPEIVSGYDDQGNAIINLANSTKDLIERKILELELDNAKSERVLENLKKEQESINKTLEIKQQHHETSKDQLNEELKLAQSAERQRQEFIEKTEAKIAKKQEKLNGLASHTWEAKRIEQQINSMKLLVVEQEKLSGTEIVAAEKQIKLYDAQFNKKNRQLILNKKIADSEVASQERLIKGTEKLIDNLKNSETLKDYIKATDKDDNSNKDAQKAAKEAERKAELELQQFKAGLKNKNNAGLKAQEEYENKYADINLKYQENLIKAKDDNSKKILLIEKDKSMNLLEAQKKINDDLIKMEADKNKALKEAENKDDAQKLIEKYEADKLTRQKAYFEEVKEITLNKQNEIEAIKTAEENKKFIFENSTKKLIEVEQNYLNNLEALRADHKVDLLSAKTSEERVLLEKELAKNEKLLALEKETAEKLIALEIEKQEKLKLATTTEDKQSITLEYNTIQNNTVNEMQQKTATVNYEYEADVSQAGTQQQSLALQRSYLSEKQQLESEYARDMFAIQGQHELDMINATDNEQKRELEAAKAHKEALLAIEHDNNNKILDLEKAKQAELANATSAEDKFMINQIYSQAIAEQEQLLAKETNSLKKNHALQQKQRKKDFQLTNYLEKTKNNAVKQAKSTLLKIEESAVSSLVRGKEIGFTQLRELGKMELQEFLFSEGTKAGMGALKEVAWAAVDFAAMNPAGGYAHLGAAGQLTAFAATAGIAGQAIELNSDNLVPDFSSDYDLATDTSNTVAETYEEEEEQAAVSEEKEAKKVYLNSDDTELLKRLFPTMNQMIDDGELEIVVKNGGS